MSRLAHIAGAVFVAGAVLPSVAFAKQEPIETFYERIFLESMQDTPENLTRMRLLEQRGITKHNGELNDISLAQMDRELQRLKRHTAALHRYSVKGMTAAQRLDYDTLDWYARNRLAGTPFRFHNYPVNQLFGVQNDYPTFMLTMHPLTSKQDADYYIARLNKAGRKFDQLLAQLQVREKRGIIPPTFVIDRVLEEMDGLIAPPASQNLLYTHFDKKLAQLGKLSPEDRQALLRQAERAIDQSVYPAYHKLIGYMTRLRAKSDNRAGVWKLPQGDAFYTYILQQSTTSDETPQQVHEMGLQEVARIQQEIRAIFKAQGYQGDEIAALLKQIADDPRFQYPDSNEGRAQILADYKQILNEIGQGVSQAFNIRPKAELDVQRIPQFKEKTSPGAYYEGPAMDGSRPGIFFANLYDIKATTRWEMRTLAYHEGIPGHHFQIAIQQEQDKLPLFRKFMPFTAYIEGWALYAERLAWEMGYQQDPFNNLGRLQGELFRAVRLVVDTGIHHQRWTREQAIDYMARNTGMVQSDVTAEIERYIVMPGQACAYKVGMMKILALREKAKQALGERFQLADFHAVVLKHGAMPLKLLEKAIDRYIEETGSSKG
ncbi:uncharacterized protein (DUF885 family) [Chitinivorax tropicus]|uniref:Uncharacterized protein (DUF885 family) n=1 Tax=Chitinivorax tropicus TaxID=714531 RepID=A0A840MPF1_9PROT|nr:DUF885 domain-containing protein [Chitinivorax tropicus]MBB5020320.1 uncharacterized protein (DUF885 family) [Chitinivorax tropicus]